MKRTVLLAIGGIVCVGLGLMAGLIVAGVFGWFSATPRPTVPPPAPQQIARQGMADFERLQPGFREWTAQQAAAYQATTGNTVALPAGIAAADTPAIAGMIIEKTCMVGNMTRAYILRDPQTGRRFLYTDDLRGGTTIAPL